VHKASVKNAELYDLASGKKNFSNNIFKYSVFYYPSCLTYSSSISDLMISACYKYYKSGENGRNNISVRANSHECPIPAALSGNTEMLL